MWWWNKMKNYWLYLEPYVYVNTIGGQTLFYNTLNGAALESGDPEIVRLARRLCHPRNLYAVKLSAARLAREPYAGVTAYLREQFMADLLDESQVEGRPMQFMPILKNMRDIETLRREKTRSPGENILSYLYRINLHITDYCHLDCDQCRRAHRQFLYCFQNAGGRKKELAIGRIREIIHRIGNQRPRLYIGGGDVLSYSRLEELCQLLQGNFPKTVFFLHLEQAMADPQSVDLLLDYGFPLQIGVTPPYDAGKLAAVNQQISEKNGRCTFLLVVQSSADVIAAEKAAEQIEPADSQMQPFFDGANHSFFRENVFNEKEHVCLQRLSHKEIFARRKTNPQQFGNITVLPDGDVYANLHARRLGWLAKHSIHEILLKELKSRKTWLRSRSQVEPCRTCVWHSLCPPVSNYEYAMGRYDMCWKHREEL
jgi:pseudo-rSAM protein